MHRTVLVLDSNPGVLIVARNVLSREGHRVIATGLVDEAVLRASEEEPAVIFVDGAFAVPEVLDALSGARGMIVPLVLLVHKGSVETESVRAQVDAAAAQFEPIGVLEKPFAPNVLVACLARALKHPPREPATIVPDDPTDEPSLQLDPLKETLPADAPTYDELDDDPLLAGAVAIDTTSTEVQFLDLLEEQPLPAAPVDPELDIEIDEDLAEGNALLAGRLGLIPADAVLQLAGRAPAAVTCCFKRDETEIEIAFRNGRIAWARRAPIRPLPSARDDSARTSLRRATEHAVHEVLGWKRGLFTVLSDRTVPPELAAVNLGLGLEQLLHH